VDKIKELQLTNSTNVASLARAFQISEESSAAILAKFIVQNGFNRHPPYHSWCSPGRLFQAIVDRQTLWCVAAFLEEIIH
jgi:hypothetical protein